MSEPSRIDHLTVLFSAMLAVLMTGKLPDNLSAEDSKEVQEVVSRVKEDVNNALKRKRLYAGVRSRVSRDLGVSSQTVKLVETGLATSARVASALSQEYQRIEQEVSGNADAGLPRENLRRRRMATLPREILQCSIHRRAFSRVACSLGLSRCWISAIAHGRKQSHMVIEAIVADVRHSEKLRPREVIQHDDGILPPEVIRACAFRGIYADIAKRLSCNASFVSNVACGRAQSKRVVNAIVAEVRRIKAATPLEGE